MVTIVFKQKTLCRCGNTRLKLYSSLYVEMVTIVFKPGLVKTGDVISAFFRGGQIPKMENKWLFILMISEKITI